ncbi:MAG: cytochrome [Pseudobdellovibrionaceae bacterium]
MFIQGNLQALFDALYEIGAIDPVLKQDWRKVSEEMYRAPDHLSQVVSAVNACGGDLQMLVNRLKQMDTKSVSFLALEVAREFAEFQDRKDLH